MGWDIIGAGAIGSLWAKRLQQSGNHVNLILRTEKQVDQFYQQGAHLGVYHSEGHTSIPCTASTPSTINHNITQLLLPTKAFNAFDALESVRSKLAASATIVVMINGYGAQQQIQKAYPDYNLFFASTTDGAFNKAPFHTVHAATGSTLIGKLENPEKRSDTPLISTDWSRNIDSVLWRKVTINSCINPVTALYSCRNGEIFLTPERTDLITALVHEIEQLEKAIAFIRDVPLLDEVKRIAHLTADNRSSMLQDVLNSRRTEIEHINGAIVKRASLHKIETPRHQEMINSIRALTQSHQ